MPKVDITKSIWVLPKNILPFPSNQLLYNALTQKGIPVLVYKGTNLGRLKAILLKKDNHVIFQNPLGKNLNSLKEILKKRRNFSVIYPDWWAVPLNPFMKYANYLVFHHLNAFRAVKRGPQSILLKKEVPLFSLPQNYRFYEILLASLRLPYLPVIPFVEMGRYCKRKKHNWKKKGLLYFPFAVNPCLPEFSQVNSKSPEYDFANLGSTSFFCRAKSYYVPAKLSFVNLYTDRLKMINSILRAKAFKVFDCRTKPVYGKETLQIIKKSKYVISTGGYHQASILKYLEIVACGTPIIGYKIPHEFPCLDKTIYELDVLSLPQKQIKKKLREAIAQYEIFKGEALKTREKIFQLYNQEAILALLQKQYDGEQIPKEYITKC